MKSLFVFIVLVVTLASAGAQTMRVSPEAYEATLKQVITEAPRGQELYENSDGFARFARAKTAARLGILPPNWANMRNSQFSSLGDLKSVTTDISNDTADQDEASIAICRTNPQLIVAGANDLWAALGQSMPAYVSTDAGHSWTTYRLPIANDLGCQAYGDPMIVCDDKGTFYYSFLLNSAENIHTSGMLSDLIVAHSTDGIHWILGNPVVGNTKFGFSEEDKETIAVDRDPYSPYYGRLYIAWMHYSGSASYLDKRMIAYSDDKGMTWSKPMVMNTTYGYFSLLRVGRGGTVFFASSHRDSITARGTNHAMMVSHDGGSTFTEHVIAPFTNYPQGSYINQLKGSIKAFPYINFDVDPSNNTVYAVYGSYQGSFQGPGYAEQFLVTSSDEGTTWSSPFQIGSQNLLNSDHFQPWVTFDPVIDRARVSLYSSEEDASNLLTRMVAFDLSSPRTPQPLGTDLFDPSIIIGTGQHRPFIGDYTGGDAYNGTFAAAWTQANKATNTSGGDIYAYVEDSSNQPIIKKINDVQISFDGPFGNPVFTTSVAFSITSNTTIPAEIQLYDAAGRECLSKEIAISPGTQSVTLDTHLLATGAYRAILSFSDQKIVRSISILY